MMRLIKLNPKEEDNFRNYHIPGCSVDQRCTVNDWKFSKNNTLEHERKKFEIAFEIWKNGSSFLMECSVNNAKPDRIIDVLCLQSGVAFEIETDFKRAKRFLGVEGTVVIPVGWNKNRLLEWAYLKSKHGSGN